jgi:hypothetical protein
MNKEVKVFTFGKYKNKKINEVTDYSYLCMVHQHKGWKHYSEELMRAVNNRISELVKYKYL